MAVDIIGVPLDLGAERRGVALGPKAMRAAGMRDSLIEMGIDIDDQGDVPTPQTGAAGAGDERLRHVDLVIPVQAELARRVYASISSGRFPLVLGGNHGATFGAVAGVSLDREIGLICLDAHGSFETPEITSTGDIHRMPLAALCGFGARRLVTLDGEMPVREKVCPKNVVLVGTRDVSQEEETLLRGAGVHLLPMSRVAIEGISAVMQQAVEVASRDTDGLYLSLDLDVVDPAEAPGVGTPVPRGLTVAEATIAMEAMAASGRLVGMDVCELNPLLDPDGATARLALDLVLAAMGKDADALYADSDMRP